MCPACAEFNFHKRTELADLSGRVALLTGGRVKIGYQAGLKLLRAGARLIVTTRFPRDSARRYAQEPDFDEWADRLEIFGLDLRHTPSVEALCTRFARKASAAGFHHQQCLPDRSSPAGILYAHDGGREGGAGGHAGEVRRLLRMHDPRTFPLSPWPKTEEGRIPSRRERWTTGRRAVPNRPARRGFAGSRNICFPKAVSIRICSRSIYGGETRGGC